MPHLNSEIIAILDFGSQYTQLIARRVRENHVYSKIYRYSTKASTLKEEGVTAIILSGGPQSVTDLNAPMPDEKIFQLGVPILGICYGLQLFGQLLGGRVTASNRREYGYGVLSIKTPSLLLKKIKPQIKVWNSHGDKLERLPEGFEAVAVTQNTECAVIQDEKRRFYGLQFHPEVSHTEQGIDILHNFLYEISGCSGNWSISDYKEKAITQIRETVKEKKVILGFSGGVDSSVAAALIHEAIGHQLTCIFVDNGLCRKNEGQQVEKIFQDHFRINMKAVDASDHFLNALKNVTDPEQKRKIIGRIFIDVFDKEVEKIENVTFLAQGTLYSDVIESVTIDNNPATLIKSHHNVGGLPEKMKLQLLEPLCELFKDEVRELGLALNLPREIVYRQPFPGPGLAVRIIGEITPQRLEILREADAILIEEMKKAGYYEKVWQSFAVFLPVQTVGVMGDSRTYEHVIALRIVESVDAMTADWARLPYDLLQHISNRIINEVRGINRVVLDISSKPPSTIEWE